MNTSSLARIVLAALFYFCYHANFAQNVDWCLGEWASANKNNPLPHLSIRNHANGVDAELTLWSKCQDGDKLCKIKTTRAKAIGSPNTPQVIAKAYVDNKSKVYGMAFKPRKSSGKGPDYLMMDLVIQKGKSGQKTSSTFIYKKVKTAPGLSIVGEIAELPQNNPPPKPKPIPSTTVGNSGSRDTPSRPSTKLSAGGMITLPNCKECNSLSLSISNPPKYVSIPLSIKNGSGTGKIPALPPGSYDISVNWKGKMDRPDAPPYRGRTFKAVSGKKTNITLKRDP